MRQKGLEKVCEIYESLQELCALCDQYSIIEMLTEWFHRDEKILILSSSVICLSLTN